MAIENTYKELFTEEYIKDKLTRGVSVSATDVDELITTELDTLDLTQPQFIAEDNHVVRLISSSASGFRSTFSTIRQDLTVLYRELLDLSGTNQKAFERWGIEAENLEKRLVDLESRIENLLLLTQDTEGYYSVLVDNFTDTSLIDTTYTTAEVDLASSTVEMGINTTNTTNARILLNNLNVNDDITFKVRTTVDMLNRIDMVGSTLADMFSQESKIWWTSINMRVQKPVTCELTVRLNPDGPISLSRILMELHIAAESSPMNITPLYSLDNRTWNQLPTTTYTVEARSKAVFSFPTIETQYIKFLLNKEGPDQSNDKNSFSYQFGFKNIMFFEQVFDTTATYSLITTPQSVLDTDGNVLSFEKLTLETCERLETDTSIDYYIATSNSPDILLDGNLDPIVGTWVPISPVQRTEKLHSHILSVGDTVATVIGDTEETDNDTEILGISYSGRTAAINDGSLILSPYMNPASAFTLLYRDSTTGDVLTESRTSTSEVRYSFTNSNERILNYQILEKYDGDGGIGLELNPNSIVLFRNIGKKGITPLDTDYLVRGVQRGWSFKDPYYSCVVEIENPNGLTIDVGPKPMIVDGIAYSNTIDNTILTGRKTLAGGSLSDSGIHTIQVHKDNWKEVTPDLDALISTTDPASGLKGADLLYPYNHKLLIEGYAYGTSYPDTDLKMYTGIDLFAETVAQRVSIFDLSSNIPSDRWDVYALSKDAPSSHDGYTNEPTTVIVIKVDENNPDFQNERFVLRFTLVNELRKYLRLRADFSTEDASVSPALHSYKIKLG